MKRLLILIIAVFLASCSQQTQPSPDEEPSQQHEDDNNTEQNGDKNEKKPGKDKSNDEEDQQNQDPEEEQDGEDVSSAMKPKYTVTESWFLKPIRDANEKVVLLTIDDAPDEYALEMAKTLKELQVKAIFFANGHFVDTEKEAKVLRKIHELGFPIGNHTYNHSNLERISQQKQRKEIVRLSDRIEKITGERPKFFRAPHGANTAYATKLAKEQNMLVMNWSYGYDWIAKYRSKEAIADIMVNAPNLNNGAILLMHDREWTKKALEAIVTGLREKGYEIVDPALIKTP